MRELSPSETPTASGGPGPEPAAACWRHTGDEAIAHLSWSPNGDALAVGSLGGALRLIDPDGTIVVTAERPGTAVTALGWAPSGRAVAAGRLDGTVIVMDATGDALRHQPVPPCPDPVWSLAWSRRGELAVAAGATLVVARSTASLRARAGLLPGTAGALCWSSGPSRLVAALGDGIHWIDVDHGPGDDGQWATVVHLPGGGPTSLVPDPDGHRLASGERSGILRILAPDTGDEMELSGYPQAVDQVAWDRTGIVLAATADDEVTLWFLDPGQVEPRHDQPVSLLVPAAVTALAFHPGADLLAAGAVDGTVTVWNPFEGQHHVVLGRGPEVMALSWHPFQPLLAAGTRAGDVHLYRVGGEPA